MPTQLLARRLTAVARVNLRTLAVSGTLILGSCTAPVPPLAGPDPSDPAVPVAAVGYRSTMSDYRGQRPVEPAPWIEQNQRVAPQDKR